MRPFILLLFFIPVFPSRTSAQGSSRVISGLVTSLEEKAPLPGVLVYVKGTKNVSGTQQDGVYYIEVTPKDSVLVFRYDEYGTKEVRLTGANEYNIVLCKEIRQKPGNFTGEVDVSVPIRTAPVRKP
jgi:hypothetical protein